MGLKFRNSILHMFYKIAINYFIIRYEPFGIKRSIRSTWCKLNLLSKITYFNFLRNYNYAQNQLKKQYINISHKNLFAINFIAPSSLKVTLTTGKSNWVTGSSLKLISSKGKVNQVNLKIPIEYKICLLDSFSFLSMTATLDTVSCFWK